MDYRTAREVLRLRRLEERARAHQVIAMAAGGTIWAMRVARPQTAVHAKAMGIVMAKVATYFGPRLGPAT